MHIVRIIFTTSKVVVASYRILATVITGYFLIRSTIDKTQHGQKRIRSPPKRTM